MHLFEYLGACYKWFFFYILNLILNKEKPVFREVLYSLNSNPDVIDSLAGGISNKIIGFLVTMIVCFILAGI